VPRKVLVAHDGGSFDLVEAPAESEHHLQEVMKNSPTLLPVDDLGITGPLLVVGREASVASGSIDLVGAVRGRAGPHGKYVSLPSKGL